ncbi:MAG: glycosyltransferase family 2 protein [Lachnospiraceae bacterium]
MKKVSIITTTYNDSANLRRIMKQIQAQDYPNIEYIIVDGASTDDTMDVIREAQELFGDQLVWISEKDTGIYDAINKGLRLATGDYIGFCFDRFASGDVISKMVDIMEKEGTDGVHGDLLYMDGDRVVRTWHQGQGNIRSGWMPGHPTLYLKKEVYETYGVYKTDYRISADYEFMIRILKDQKVKLSYIPEVLIYMSHGGTSTNGLKAYLESLKEGHRALKENQVPFAIITDLLRILRVLYQFVKH